MADATPAQVSQHQDMEVQPTEELRVEDARAASEDELVFGIALHQLADMPADDRMLLRRQRLEVVKDHSQVGRVARKEAIELAAGMIRPEGQETADNQAIQRRFLSQFDRIERL